MREIGRRLCAAWAVLRHGVRPVPAAAATATVGLAELVDLVERSLAVVRLPYAWANEATADEMKTARNALELALTVRRAEWAHVESGGWPSR
jgi:hypothetical protein